jgi:hypothetical protein
MKALLALAVSTFVFASPVFAKPGLECDFSSYAKAQNAESRAEIAAEEWAAYSREKKKGIENFKAAFGDFRSSIKGTSNEDLIIYSLKISFAESRIDQEMRKAHPLAVCFENATKYPALTKRFFEGMALAYMPTEGVAAVYSEKYGFTNILMYHSEGLFSYTLKSGNFHFWDEGGKTWQLAKGDVKEALNPVVEKLFGLLAIKRD